MEIETTTDEAEGSEWKEMKWCCLAFEIGGGGSGSKTEK